MVSFLFKAVEAKGVDTSSLLLEGSAARLMAGEYEGASTYTKPIAVSSHHRRLGKMCLRLLGSLLRFYICRMWTILIVHGRPNIQPAVGSEPKVHRRNQVADMSTIIARYSSAWVL